MEKLRKKTGKGAYKSQSLGAGIGAFFAALGRYFSFWRRHPNGTSIHPLLPTEKGAGDHNALALPMETSTVKEWIKAVEILHPIVRKRQLEIDLLDAKSLTFDLLGASTYLLQVDILLSKNKKYFQTYQRREREFNDIEKECHLEFLKTTISCRAVYQSVLYLTMLIRDVPLKKLNSKEIVKAIHLLERQARETAVTLEILNDAVLKKGPLYQLFENDLFKALYEIEQSHAQLKPTVYSPFKDSASTALFSLREHAQSIQDPDLRIIAVSLINQYESLNKYMIFSSSEVLIAAFKVFYKHVVDFTKEAVKYEQGAQGEEVILHALLNDVFISVESIRFVANKKDSFAKNLQDAARATKKQLLKNLEKTQKGKDFLNLHKRMSVKQKLNMRSRFK